MYTFLGNRIMKTSLVMVLFCSALCLLGQQPAFAEEIDSSETTEIYLIRGELVNVRVHSLTRLSISDPGIADVVSADADNLLILGKSVGETLYFIWDSIGKRTLFVRVFDADLNNTKLRIEKLLESGGIDLEETGIAIKVNPYEGKVVVSGDVPKPVYEHVKEIVGRFGEVVLDFTEEKEAEDLIQIDVQITELSTTLQQSLGFDWTTDDNNSPIFTITEGAGTFGSSETGGTYDRIFKLGQFSRTSALVSTINMLIAEGRARILSKPSLVVVDGKEARLQIGGQIPVRTTTASSGGSTSQENVEFKDFGILMTITPQIRDGKVDVTLEVEVSDVDASNAVGDDVAFSTRSASTDLFLEDGQTIVLAGLIKQSKSVTSTRVPFLGKIPVVGMFFRNKETPVADKDQELVISLKPTILYAEQLRREKEAMDLAKQRLWESDDQMRRADSFEYAEEGDIPPFGDDDSMLFHDTSDDYQPSGGAEASGSYVEADDQFDTRYQIKADTAEDDAAEVSDDDTQEASEEDAYDFGIEDDDFVTGDDGDAGDETDLTMKPIFDYPEELYPMGMDLPDAIARYVQLIQKKVSNGISYPHEAVEKGWSGTAKLSLKILKDGSLEEASLKASSGHDLFDRDALDTARLLAPFEAFPPNIDLQELVITMPIVYSQTAQKSDTACHSDISVDLFAEAGAAALTMAPGRPYAEHVKKRISKMVIYPQEAEQYGWEGTVKLTLKILSDGTLAYATVKESSGYPVFDECALKTAKLVAPYSVFPANSDLQELNVTIPVTYSLGK